MGELLRAHRPDAVVHFAAESHVDRSIEDAQQFVRTNVLGTQVMLDAAWRSWGQDAFKRFVYISTDEVYGALALDDPRRFAEDWPLDPKSPYSASKAGADLMAMAYHHTHGLPVIITRCSNNYGPFQFPEKLIPLMILNAMDGKPLPVYGDGLNVRDWLYVEDHCNALRVVMDRGRIGEVYNIGGRCEKTNLEVVQSICRLLDEMIPHSPFKPHSSLIAFVTDRPGHDRRYAVNCDKIERELGWRPEETFDTGISKTIAWYMNHRNWVESVKTGAYRQWMRTHYGLA